MIKLAATGIEGAENAKGNLLPRAGPFDSGSNQYTLLDWVSQHFPRDTIVEVRNRVSDIIERLVEHLDPRIIPLANPVLSAKYGGGQTLMATIHIELKDLGRESNLPHMKWMAHESDESVAKRSPDSSSDETKKRLKLPRYNQHLNRPRL
jgi:hypothetical protein